MPCLRAYIALSASRRRSSGERVPSRSSTTPTLAEIVFGAMIGHGSASTRPDAFDEPARVGLVARRSHQDDELVAAEARDQVVGAHDPPEPRRDLDEHLVAHVVTEGVVDVLEVVEVDEREDRGLARRARRSSASVNAPRLRSWVSESVDASCASCCSAVANLLFDRVARREGRRSRPRAPRRARPGPTAAMTCDWFDAHHVRREPGLHRDLAARPRRRRTSRAPSASRCRGSARASGRRQSANAMSSTAPHPLAYRIGRRHARRR